MRGIARAPSKELQAMLLSDRLTEGDFAQLGEQFPGWQIEWIDGRFVLSPPTGWHTGRRNARLTALLQRFADAHGYVSGGSSAGVRLPNGDVLSPDEMLVKAERLTALTPDESESFLTLVPDVVVELISPSDRGRDAPFDKCRRWLTQGVTYVVLLDPFAHAIHEWGEALPGFPDLREIVGA